MSRHGDNQHGTPNARPCKTPACRGRCAERCPSGLCSPCAHKDYNRRHRDRLRAVHRAWYQRNKAVVNAKRAVGKSGEAWSKERNPKQTEHTARLIRLVDAGAFAGEVGTEW